MDFDVKFDASPSQHSSVPSNSSENFQKFMYDLFEKNGILNNLRAHLRSHIINVLKSATNGNEPMSTTINFKKHLEPNHQALNILLAEYLLKMELNYSLSVFVSEIPLANLPFGFAKLLMQSPEVEMQAHKLKEDDIISVLNCLGIHCDSDLICQVMGVYKNTDTSLLQCILQSLTFAHKKNRNFYDFHPSNHQVEGHQSHSSSSIKSSDFEKNKQNDRSLSPTCNHIRKCTVCEGKITKLKEKYANKIRHYKKNATTEYTRDSKKHNLSNIDVLEKRLIDEMFQEVRSVYEGELQMLKASEERRIHASVASHAIALKKRIAQLEEQYHQKEAQLQSDVRDKKQLLRNLMDSIQHEHKLLTNTIGDINQEAQKLAEKEEQMKKQIQDAEQFIRQRSQEMTNQIQCELEILITHLRSLKEEKQIIAKEKTELENLKKFCERSPLPETRVNDLDCKDPEHILITSQLKKLKHVLDSLGVNKNVIERSTITELKDVTSKLNVILNNEQEIADDRPNSFKITPNKLFNQFRKDKNINFCVSDPEEGRRDLCTSSSYRNIRKENENLRTIAAQQSARIQELSNEVARAQHSLQSSNSLRATVFQPFHVQLQRLSAMPGSNNPAGGGEELNAFRSRPVSAPAVAVPFINSQQDAHCSRQRPSRHAYKQSKTRRGLTHDKVLQEARRTLRKLEIEAEAVHSSYVEFKRKRDTRLDSGSREKLSDPKAPPNSVSPAAREVMAGTTQISHHEKLFKSLTESVRLVNPIPEDYGALRPPRERTRNYVDTPLTEFRKLYHCTENHSSKEKPLEQSNRGIFINDENVISTTNLDVPEEKNVATILNESRKAYNKTQVTDVYTCGVINDFQNKCAEICFDITMRDIATSESDEQPCMLKVEIENVTNCDLIEGQPKKPFVLLEIQNIVDTNEVQLVTVKPSEIEIRKEPNTSAEIISAIEGNENNMKSSPTDASIKSDLNLVKINDKIEKLKIENEDYQNDGFEETSSDENILLKSEQEQEKTRLNTINEEDKSDKMFELLSNTTNDLEMDGEGDEYPDDFSDLVASGDSPKSIPKQYSDTDNENFWKP